MRPVDSALRAGLRIALIYALVGTLWIVLSDQLVNVLFSERELVQQISLYKGFAFVALTALTLMWLVVRRERLLESERTHTAQAELRGFMQATEANQARLETLIRSRTEALQIALAQSELAAKAKNIFLANMGHEIRTPLNALLGSVHLLNRSELDPQQRERVQQIERSGLTLLGLMNDVLAFSDIDAGQLVLEPRPFDLAVLLQEACQAVQVEMGGKPIVLDWEPTPVPVDLVGDAERIKMALGHYLSNAVKFTATGQIRVVVELLTRLEGGQGLFRFGVRDTGVGVDPQVMPHLFGAFTQADASSTRRFGGSGLGLAIVRRLAELMGGEAGAESQLGQGSFFWFTVILGYQSGRLLSEAKLVQLQGPSWLPNGWPEQLLQIPGLDLKRGQDISRGHLGRYLHLLKMFADNHDQDMARLNEARANPDSGIEQMITITHALKGAAGNLGANAVAEQARQIVDGLRSGQSLDSLLPSLDNLGVLLPALIAQIRGVTTVAMAPAVGSEAMDEQALVNRLKVLLAEGDMAANEVVREQIDVLSGVLDSSLEAFVQRVEAFNYEEALALLLKYRP